MVLLQVHTYLNTYAADRRASLPSGDLQRVNHLYSAACDVKLEEAKQGGDADLDRYIEIQRPASSYGMNSAILHYAVMVAGPHYHELSMAQACKFPHSADSAAIDVNPCCTYLQLLSLHAARFWVYVLLQSPKGLYVGSNSFAVCCSFLQAAAELARNQWTQFNMPLMLLGLLLFTACLLLQAHTLWSRLVQCDNTSTALPSQRCGLMLPAGAVFLGLLHAAGLFSDNFLLAEGQMVCFLIATFSLLLLHATLAARLQQPSAEVDVHARSGSICSGGSISASNKLHSSKTVAVEAHGPFTKHSFGAKPDEGDTISTTGQGKSSCTQVDKRLCQQMRWNRQCWYAVLWGVGLLVCNALMGSMGLIVRTGHDAMHKAAPTSKPAQHMQPGAGTLPDAVLPDLGNRSSVHTIASTQWLSAALVQTQDLLAPLVCVLMFPFVILHANANPVSSGRGEHSIARLQVLTVQSVWFSYLVLALYWIIAQAGQADSSILLLCEPVLSAVSWYLGKNGTHILYTAARRVPSHVYVLSRGLHQPFQLLMPRIVFLSSAFSFTALLISAARDQWQLKGAAKPQAGSSKACTFIAALIAPMLLVFGPSKGLVCALGLLQWTCVLKLLQCLPTCYIPATSGVGADGIALTPSQSEGWLGVTEGCLWALLSMQLFFCSGHFCEFAGLQYAAGN